MLNRVGVDLLLDNDGTVLILFIYKRKDNF